MNIEAGTTGWKQSHVLLIVLAAAGAAGFASLWLTADAALVPLVAVLALMAGAAGAWAAAERVRRRALETAVFSCAAMAGQDAAAARRSVQEALCAIDREMAAARSEAQRQAAERSRAEAALRESQERYCLAVRGASDGVWEWNFRTRQAHFSSRAKSMLGYAEDELGDDVAAWQALIHPADLEAALDELRRFVNGSGERFECEHRMRHKDGSWRWVLARATIVRHPSGRPERMIGLYSDITSRRLSQQVLLDLADGLASVQGEACFQALVRAFARTLGVREAFVCECSDPASSRVRMLARWNGETFDRCVEFDLAGTACEEVVSGAHTVFQPRNAGARWPIEKLFDRDSYLGLPCLDTQGHVIGHIACADPGPMPDSLPHRAILKIFAVRAAVELERRQLERERRAVGMREATGGQLALH